MDSKTKLIHSMETTAANVHDAKVLGELLHGDETRVYGDQAYRGQKDVIRDRAPNAKDFTNQRYRHRGVVDEVERGKPTRKCCLQGRAVANASMRATIDRRARSTFRACAISSQSSGPSKPLIARTGAESGGAARGGSSQAEISRNAALASARPALPGRARESSQPTKR